MTLRSTFAGLAVALSLLTGAAPALAQEAPTPLKVNVMPFLDAGPILIAQKNGIFRKHGLDVTIDVAASGATVVPTVLSGQYDIGYANVISALQAIDNGLPLVLVHPTYHHPADPQKDPYRVYVGPDGPIKEPRQLADANIGTLSVRNIAEWGTRKSLENIGITDHSRIRWTRVSGEDGYDAVKNGQIDAIWLYEPLGAAAKAAGLVPILSTNAGSIPGAASGYFNTSRTFAEAHPDVLTRFKAALSEANDYAPNHIDELRAAVIEKFNFNPAFVETADLNSYNNDPALESLDEIASDLVRFGLVKQKATVSEIYWKDQ